MFQSNKWHSLNKLNLITEGCGVTQIVFMAMMVWSILPLWVLSAETVISLHRTVKDGIWRWGAEARLHFKTTHLNYQRLKFGLTGNSTRGSLRFSSDPNHLLKVTPRVTGSNQQGRVKLRSSRPAGSLQLSGPTWWPAICAIAGRTRPLATTSRRSWGLAQAPPVPGEARGGGARHRKEEGRARGGGAHLYRPPPRRRGQAWARAAQSEVFLVPQTPPARTGRGEGEGGRRRHECGVAPVHLRSSPGSRRLSKAGPGCGSGGGGSGLGGLRRWSQAAAAWVGAAGASGRPARVDRVGRPLPGVQDGSASLGRGPGGQVARASYADRPPRGTCRSGPCPLLRRPDDCGRPGVAALGGPRARLVEAPLARALRGPGACFVLAPGMLLKGSGEISADARGWKGSRGHGRAV